MLHSTLLRCCRLPARRPGHAAHTSPAHRLALVVVVVAEEDNTVRCTFDMVGIAGRRPRRLVQVVVVVAA